MAKWMLNKPTLQNLAMYAALGNRCFLLILISFLTNRFFKTADDRKTRLQEGVWQEKWFLRDEPTDPQAGHTWPRNEDLGLEFAFCHTWDFPLKDFSKQMKALN